MMQPSVPGSPPIELGPIDLVVLQGTPFCNLNCSYCYLTESSRRDRASLSLASLERIFRGILTSRFLSKKVFISWHSGEPMVLGPSYYDAAIETILRLREAAGVSDVTLQFDMQTNGTLINEEWCSLFKKWRGVLDVGVSCDGPAFLHDAHRKNWTGKPTHEQVLRGMNLLSEHGIQFDLIAVATQESLDHPREFFDFFCSHKDQVREFHFNLVDESSLATQDVAGRDAYAEKYDRFLKSLLEAIQAAGAKPIKIRNISDFYARIFAEPEVKQLFDARYMSRPFRSLSVDVHGNVSTFYAGLTADESRDLYGDGQGLLIGNLVSQTLEEIARSEKLRRIAEDFETSHRACEAACDYYPLCSGGFNLIKHKRFGTFAATETPECFVQVKTFANTLLEDMNKHTGNGGGQ